MYRPRGVNAEKSPRILRGKISESISLKKYFLIFYVIHKQNFKVNEVFPKMDERKTYIKRALYHAVPDYSHIV